MTQKKITLLKKLFAIIFPRNEKVPIYLMEKTERGRKSICQKNQKKVDS